MDALQIKIDRKALGNLRLRVLAAVVGMVVIVGALFVGSAPFALVVAAISALALREFYALFRAHRYHPNEVLGLIAGALFPLSALVFGKTGLVGISFLLVLATLLWYVAFSKTRLADMAITVFGAVYVGFLLSFLVLIRGLDHGPSLVLLVLAATWINDTVAYFVGVTIGQAKLAPKISPGKTWEGTIGGIAATTAALAALGIVSYLDVIERTILGAVVATSAIAGDLVESRIKRELKVKDSGVLIPGHGGFLDRFDSMVFVSGAAYFILTMLFKLR